MLKKSMKLLCACILLILGLCGLMTNVGAQDKINVKVDENIVTFDDQDPMIIDDRTMVPMRKIFETLGATIQWDEATSTVTAVKGDTTIVLKVGDSTAQKNGEQVQMEIPAQILNSRTMVPLRFVSEAMGATVNWDDSTKTVAIQTANGERKSGSKLGQEGRTSESQEQMKERILKEFETLISDGTITQEQAEKIVEAFTTRDKDAEKDQEQRKNPLSSLVEQGTITQEQADAAMKVMQTKQPQGGMNFGNPEEMKKKIEEGLETLINAGTITQEQADKIVEAFTSRDKDMTTGQEEQNKSPLSSLVEQGVITQEQANAVTQAMPSRQQGEKPVQENNE